MEFGVDPKYAYCKCGMVFDGVNYHWPKSRKVMDYQGDKRNEKGGWPKDVPK